MGRACVCVLLVAVAAAAGDTTLERHGLQPTAESIGTFLRTLYADEAEERELHRLVGLLDSTEPGERTFASRRIKRMGIAALPLLQAMPAAKDPEMQRRLRRLTRHARGLVPGDALVACFRAIGERRLPGLAPELVAVLPLCGTHHMRQNAANALCATVVPPDAALLRASLDQPAVVLAYGALLRRDAAPLLHRMAREAPEPLRMAAARALAEQGLAVCLPILGELLDADDADVRRWCAQTLRQISGEAFGYSPADARGHRAAATREWRRWIRANESVATWETPLPRPPALLGRTLVSLWTDEMIVEYDAAGNKTWELSGVKEPWACQGLPNGHRLVAFHKDRKIVEYDARGRVVWTHGKLPSRPTCVERLPNGNTLIVCRRILEVTPDHKIVWNARMSGVPTDARRVRKNRFLVTLYRSGVVEIDRDMKVYWRLQIAEPTGAQPLPNGNVLVCQPSAGRVVEYNRAGEIVWSRAGLSWCNCVQRLPNGNTLITDRNSLREIDSNLNTHWGKALTGIKCAWRY